MKIEIVKRDVFDNLHRISAHLGMKLQASEFVASTPDDEPKIEIMWKHVLAGLLNILQPYATLEIKNDRAVYTLDMPANWKSEHLGNLIMQCCIYVDNELYAVWLDSVKPDSATFYRSLNKETSLAIVHLLELRKRPVR